MNIIIQPGNMISGGKITIQGIEGVPIYLTIHFISCILWGAKLLSGGQNAPQEALKSLYN